MKGTYLGIGVLLVIIGGVIWAYQGANKAIPDPTVLSFEDCVAAGYPVMESYPRQCATPDGRTYAEELPPPPVTYVNASTDLIVVDAPAPGSVTGKEFSVVGKARGSWYFEASFPIQVLDTNDKVLFESHAEAIGDWMTGEFVPFKVDIKVPDAYIGAATIVLKNDNASGEPERDRSASFPITIEY